MIQRLYKEPKLDKQWVAPRCLLIPLLTFLQMIPSSAVSYVKRNEAFNQHL